MSPHLDLFNSVTVKNINGRFEVSWDYQRHGSGLEVLKQCERLDGYIDGFLDGLLVALEVPARNIHRSSSLKYAISDLDAHVALRLEQTLTKLFQPLARLEGRAALVHLANPQICASCTTNATNHVPTPPTHTNSANCTKSKRLSCTCRINSST